MQFRPYQEEDAEWLSRQRHAFLLHDPRVGKTIVALHAASIRGSKRIAVATRAIAREQWRAEAKIWAPGAEVLVESYERIATNAGTRRAIESFRPDVFIIDEGQRIKSPDAKRTRALYGWDCTGAPPALVWNCAVWVLSGSLTPNHIGEAWTHLRRMERTTLTYPSFLRRYCETYQGEYGIVVTGVKEANLQEFRALFQGIYRRRRFHEVFPNVERPLWTNFELPVSKANRAKLDQIEADLNIKAVRMQLNFARTVEVKEQILASAKAHSSSLRDAIGQVKAPLVADEIENLLESGVPQIVLFGWHRSTLDILEDRLCGHGLVRVDGATPDRTRNVCVADFQAGRARIFLGQILATCEAIPLHAGQMAVFAESSWTLGDMIQAAKRIVSPTRTTRPEIMLCSLPGTIDDDVNRAVFRKIPHLDTLNTLGA